MIWFQNKCIGKELFEERTWNKFDIKTSKQYCITEHWWLLSQWQIKDGRPESRFSLKPCCSFPSWLLPQDDDSIGSGEVQNGKNTMENKQVVSHCLLLRKTLPKTTCWRVLVCSHDTSTTRQSGHPATCYRISMVWKTGWTTNDVTKPQRGWKAQSTLATCLIPASRKWQSLQWFEEYGANPGMVFSSSNAWCPCRLMASLTTSCLVLWEWTVFVGRGGSGTKETSLKTSCQLTQTCERRTGQPLPWIKSPVIDYPRAVGFIPKKVLKVGFHSHWRCLRSHLYNYLSLRRVEWRVRDVACPSFRESAKTIGLWKETLRFSIWSKRTQICPITSDRYDRKLNITGIEDLHLDYTLLVWIIKKLWAPPGHYRSGRTCAKTKQSHGLNLLNLNKKTHTSCHQSLSKHLHGFN